MRLQTKHAHKKLSTINVNGHVYEVDAHCCVDVDDEKDATKLLSLGDEWSAEVRASVLRTISKIPEPGKPLRNAVEFVALLAQDTELAAKVSSLRSFASLSSLASNLGFRFSENEFRAATEQFQKDAERAAQLDAERTKKDAEKSKAKDGKKGKAAEKPPEPAPAPAETDHRKSEKLPKKLDEEVSGEWPDPEVGFSDAYLKRMAAAYGVEYPAGTAKAEVVAMITKAMYE